MTNVVTRSMTGRVISGDSVLVLGEQMAFAMSKEVRQLEKYRFEELYVPVDISLRVRKEKEVKVVSSPTIESF